MARRAQIRVDLKTLGDSPLKVVWGRGRYWRQAQIYRNDEGYLMIIESALEGVCHTPLQAWDIENADFWDFRSPRMMTLDEMAMPYYIVRAQIAQLPITEEMYF